MATAQAEQALRGLPAIAAIFRRLMPTSGAAREIAALDGLRALAILLVFYHHLYLIGLLSGLNAGPPFLTTLEAMGFCGVFLFFALSGFLLFLPYARSLLAGQPWPSVRLFYLRRALRILPAYYVVLFTLILLRVHPFQAQYVAPLTFAALLLQDLRTDAFSIISVLNTPFWTLTIEWQFYLLLPWLALLLAKVAGARTGRALARRLMLGLGTLIALGLSIRLGAALLHYIGGQENPIDTPGVVGLAMTLLYGVKGKYLEVFALGIAVSLLYVYGIEQGHLSQQRRMLFGSLAVGTSLVGLAGCTFWAVVIHHLSPSAMNTHEWVFPQNASWSVLGEWSLGLCFALLLFGVLVGPAPLRWLFSLAPLRFIGIISYSLYVWHWPILMLFIHAFLSYGRLLLFASVFLLLFCTASYYLIERPFIRYRRAAHTPAERRAAPVPLQS